MPEAQKKKPLWILFLLLRANKGQSFWKINMKFSISSFNFSKLLGIIILVTLFLFLPIYPAEINASLTPLVQCGPGFPDNPVCELCHLFCMLNRIVEFFLMVIVPPIAALMLTIGGFMFFFAGGDPQKLESSKKIIKSVVIGLFIIYGAYILVSSFLTAIGVAEWTGARNWFDIPCP